MEIDFNTNLKLYSSLANWWPLLSNPADYEEEAKIFIDIFLKWSQPVHEILELGSGGGNNASYLKRCFQMTLVDLSPQMIEVSKRLNPECNHLIGDMRTLRLEKKFDAVFIHDAISSMTSKEDLAKAIQTGAVHCRSGGIVFIVPDHFKETFHERTTHGGSDRDGKGLRYLQWQYDPNCTDSTYVSNFVYMLKDEFGTVAVEHETLVNGLFDRETWRHLFREAGLTAEILPLPHSQTEGWCAILGKKD